MEEPVQTSPAPPADHPSEQVEERFPFSTREMIRQIYVLSGAVVVLLSLAIWLLISLS